MSLLKTNANDHIQGADSATIEIIEYGDYQCPYCAKAYYILKKAQQQLGDKMRLVFRNYPIEQLHPYAIPAALAAETAAQQGKFWEMHDKLFENHKQLDDASLLRYAQEVGLDKDAFTQAFGNEEAVKKVRDDIDSGNAARIEGTPAFFINGKTFQGDWTAPDFMDYLSSIAES